jgi:hypothetical protein
MARYIVSASGGRSIELRRGGTLGIGRHPRNDLVLEDCSVSRFHARLEWPAVGSSPAVLDLDSTNGTRVEGVRAARATLGELSRLTLGDVPLTVMLVHPSIIAAAGATRVRLFDEWGTDSSGDLREAAGVKSLLLELERGRRTVSFHLSSAGGFEACVTFAGGRIVAASAAGLRGADALRALLSRPEGGRYRVDGEVELCDEPVEPLPPLRQVFTSLSAQAS